MFGEYLETHPLGKLEWIKIAGLLYNRYDLAIEKFNEIASRYNTYVKLTEKLTEKPTVALGIPWKGTWYISGGDSYIARLIEDAGGNYLWSHVKSHISQPFPLEKIYQHIQYADFWINTGDANSIKEIIEVDQRFNKIKPVKESHVYNNNKQVNETGGNAYWEQGIIEPDVILADLIRIFHPEILPDKILKYYQPLK
jgi:iron complex transport system substrate-binding protein